MESLLLLACDPRITCDPTYPPDIEGTVPLLIFAALLLVAILWIRLAPRR